MDDPDHSLHSPLHSLRSLSPAGPTLHFHLLASGGPPRLRLRAVRPGLPGAAAHEGELSLPEFRALVATLTGAGQARPTLVFRSGPEGAAGRQVDLHLTTRSRRPGKLSVRSEGRPDVLNFSLLSPVAEEFQCVLDAVAALSPAQP